MKCIVYKTYLIRIPSYNKFLAWSLVGLNVSTHMIFVAYCQRRCTITSAFKTLKSKKSTKKNENKKYFTILHLLLGQFFKFEAKNFLGKKISFLVQY